MKVRNKTRAVSRLIGKRNIDEAEWLEGLQAWLEHTFGGCSCCEEVDDAEKERLMWQSVGEALPESEVEE